uniref:Uncharacterized protein n=1 Tax=Setaria italica TaxID=4555 RepID=K4A3V0_SETIT
MSLTGRLAFFPPFLIEIGGQMLEGIWSYSTNDCAVCDVL